MGFSVRAFVLDKKGELRRFSHARLERLYRHDPRESLPESAGADARFAVAYIETDDGDPSGVAHIDYVRLYIGPDGRADQEAVRRSLALAAGSIDLPALPPKADRLIEAQHIFNRRRFQGEFAWKPTAAQKQSLVRLIWEQWRRRPRR